MTKKVLAIILAFMLVLPTVAVYADTSVPKEKTIEIHVSTNGTANGDGSVYNPLDSLESVKNKLLEVKYQYPANPIDIIFHEGEYRVQNKVVFGPEFSGTKDAPIRFISAKGEGRPVIKGSKKLDLSKAYKVTDETTLARIPAVSRNEVIAIDLAEQGVTEYGVYNLVPEIKEGRNSMLSTIFFNGREQTRSRWPNGEHEYSRPTAVLDIGKQRTKGEGATFQIDSYRLMNWLTADEAYYIGYPSYDYQHERLRVKGFDPLSKTVSLLDGNVYAEGMRLTYSARFAIENILEELDVPGEFYIDRKAKILYYYPERSLQGATLEISHNLDHLMWFEDTKYITIEGIEFAQLNKFAFRAVGRCDYFTVRDCIFRDFGWAAFAVDSPKGGNSQISPNSAYNSVTYQDGGSEHVLIENNAFYHGGVRAVEVRVGSKKDNIPSGTIIRNNYIYDMGTYMDYARGISVDGVGAEVTNNTIQYTGHAINPFASDLDVSYNEIGNVMNNIADGAAIYGHMNLLNRNVNVHHNFIHEAKGRSTHLEKAYCYGIYADGMASGWKVYNNIVANSDAGFILNAGTSNQCFDNTFYNTTSYSLCFTTKGWQSVIDGYLPQALDAIKTPGYSRYADLVKDLQTPGNYPYAFNNVIKGNMATIDNSTKQTEGALKINEWQSDIIVSADDFVDIENFDYRFKSGSNAAKANPSALNESNFNNKFGVDTTKFKYPLEIGEEFKLIYPQNGTKDIPTKDVEFNWQRPIGGDKFTVIIATDPEMKNVVATKETYEVTTTVKDLQLGQTYYWKVKTKCSTQAGNLMEWESAEAPYMFSVADKEVASADDLIGAIATGKATLEKVKEGNKLGDYKPGTRKALEKALEKAEILLNKEDRTKQDVANVTLEIESITNDDNLINGGSVNIGTLLKDTEGWVYSLEQGSAEPHATITPDELVLWGGNGKLTTGGGSTSGHVSYTGVTPYSRMLAMSFKIKAEYPEDIEHPWFSLGLRAQIPASYTWLGGNHSYYFILKDGGAEYQRNSPSTGAVWIADTPTPLSTNGEWMDVDMAVINLGNVGQLLLLMIDGEIIYEIIDTSDAQMLKKGCFSISATERVKVTIKPSTRPLLNFNELVKKYTEKMAIDACVNMHNINDSKGAEGSKSNVLIIADGAKKAYYNRKLYDIKYPAYYNGKGLMVHVATVARLLGVSNSGNTISYKGKTVTFEADSTTAMVNGEKVQLKTASEMKNNNLYVDLTDFTTMIGWNMYNNMNKSALVADQYNMHINDLQSEYTVAQNSLLLYK